MADKSRQRQVTKVARNIAGEFFVEHNPAGQLVTVHRVETNEKISLLHFFVSVMPETNKEDDLSRLEDKLPQLRKRIGDAISFRKVPEVRISFARRKTAESKVEEALKRARNN
jgi:ribosome-binding factor A